MLDSVTAELDMAIAALMRDTDPEEVGQRLRKRDREVNRTERAIRRELVVIGGVRGGGDEIPLLLIYMSIIKDIERAGDYCKNIWDLAAEGVDLSDAPDRRQIEDHVARIRQMIKDTARIFPARDAEAAREVLPAADDLLDEYDRLVAAQLTSDQPSSHGTPRALLYRYFKRIVAHLMNVITAVVMPLHRLDFWDEDKIDRDLLGD